LIHWPPRLVCSVVYALLAERADAADRAELALAPHVKDEARADMSRNREELDAWLSAPIGKQAAAEAALLRELGGAA
jgi:hypothetical protein